MKNNAFILIVLITFSSFSQSEITITKLEGSPEYAEDQLPLAILQAGYTISHNGETIERYHSREIFTFKKSWFEGGVLYNNHPGWDSDYLRVFRYLEENLEERGASIKDFQFYFDFDLRWNKNFLLGAQTAGANDNGLANSAQGQHIHMIVNNGPYSAHYKSRFFKKLEKGNNVILFFLSRSFHESVKNPRAFILTQVQVGKTEEKPIDLSSEFLFYSRPKGVYKGADTKKLLLDFYLVNTEISPQGNKVRATINGKEFIIEEWAPYYIEGLPLGEVTVKLELINSNGELIDVPFNPVERKVTLE